MSSYQPIAYQLSVQAFEYAPQTGRYYPDRLAHCPKQGLANFHHFDGGQGYGNEIG